MNEQNRGEGLGLVCVCVRNKNPSLSCVLYLFFVCVWVLTGFGKALSSPSPGAHSLSNYSQLSHHAFQQYQLSGIPEGHSTPSDLGLMTGGTLWDLDNTAHSVGSYCGSGHQQGCSQTGKKKKSYISLSSGLFVCLTSLALLLGCRSKFDRGTPARGEVSPAASGRVHQDQ